MNAAFRDAILNATGSRDISERETVQSLWSGYGKISRYSLEGSSLRSIIIKRIQLPDQGKHPRGWNTDLSHQRKVRSYQVECQWYSSFNAFCPDTCRTPRCFAIEQTDGETWIALEDLDAAGFDLRRRSVSTEDLSHCLDWLAAFHATFLGKEPKGLWPQGTYWHLATRPDELKALDDLPLKNAANAIDQMLQSCRYKTLVHGDAKLANFCFHSTNGRVAAVDFQYVGGGCGMKDVAYFIGSCLDEDDCERMEAELLDRYFASLQAHLDLKGISADTESLIAEWRELYPFAWADFHRFLKGWSPGHWKINTYSERITKQVLQKLSAS